MAFDLSMKRFSTTRKSRTLIAQEGEGRTGKRKEIRNLESSLTYRYVVDVHEVSWSNMLKFAGQDFSEYIHRKRKNQPCKSTVTCMSLPNPSPQSSYNKIKQSATSMMTPRLCDYSWKSREERKPGPTQAADRPYRHSLEFSESIIAQNEPEEPTMKKTEFPNISTSQRLEHSAKHPAEIIRIEELYNKLHRSKAKDKTRLITTLKQQLPNSRRRQLPKVVPHFYQRIENSLEPPNVQYANFDNTELTTIKTTRPLTSEKVRYRPLTQENGSINLQGLYLNRNSKIKFETVGATSNGATSNASRETRKQYKSVEPFNKLVESLNCPTNQLPETQETLNSSSNKLPLALEASTNQEKDQEAKRAMSNTSMTLAGSRTHGQIDLLSSEGSHEELAPNESTMETDDRDPREPIDPERFIRSVTITPHSLKRHDKDADSD